MTKNKYNARAKAVAPNRSSMNKDARKFNVDEYTKNGENLALFLRAFEQSPVTIVITDTEGNIEFANPNFVKTTGYSLEEARGKNPRILKSGNMDPKVYQDMWEAISHGETWHGAFCNRRKNGELYWESASISPVLNPAGQITHFIAIKEDITFRKSIEEALESSHSMLAATLDSINDGLIAFDNKGNITLFNRQFLKMWSLEEVSLSSKNEADIFRHFHSMVIDPDGLVRRIEESKTDKGEAIYDVLHRRDSRVYEYSSRPQELNTTIVGRIWTFRDITEKAKANDKLLWYTKDLELAKLTLEEQRDMLSKTILELKEAKDVAETATRSSNEFLANMSHEIRTPMNAILGFTQLLSESITDEKQKKYLKAISSSGNNLMRLINDILDLSKIEAGKFELQYEQTEIRKIFDEIKQMFELKTNEKELGFIFEIAKDIPRFLSLDEIRLRQILFNLVGNAIKFTDNGYVKVICDFRRVSFSTVDLIIQIEDTGIGIPYDQQEEVFDAFKQQSSAINRKYGGTGLGLAITKRLAEMMNGAVELISQPGLGSVFTVNLFGIQVAPERGYTEKEPEKQTPRVEFLPSKLLLVDDVALNRQLIAGFLESSSVSIFEAENGKDAIELCLQIKFDMILMDIKMPIMDGYRAAQVLRSNEDTSDIPIVALTASIIKDQFKLLREKGFSGYLLKPVTKSELFIEMMKYMPYLRLETESGSDNDLFEKREFDEISDAAVKRSTALIKTLDLTLIPQWEMISKSSVIDDIKKFATEVSQAGNIYGATGLVNYGSVLSAELNSFDFDKFPKTLDQFPLIVESIKAKLGNNKK